LIATAAGTAVAAPTRTFVEEVQPGIQHEIWEQTGVVRIHLVRVDLTSHRKDFPEITGPGVELAAVKRLETQIELDPPFQP